MKREQRHVVNWKIELEGTFIGPLVSARDQDKNGLIEKWKNAVQGKLFDALEKPAGLKLISFSEPVLQPPLAPGESLHDRADANIRHSHSVNRWVGDPC